MENPLNLSTLIVSGESELLEFKESFSDEVIKTLVAFANTKEGKVLIGISDKNKIIGINLQKETVQKWVNLTKNKTLHKIIPDTEIIEHENKKIVVFSIIEYPSKPISFQGKYYKRHFNSNHEMSAEEIINDYLRTRNKSWDMFTDGKYSLEDLDFKKVFDTILKINKNKNVQITEDPLLFLKKFGLIDGEKVTNAAMLLFPKLPDIYADIQIGLFETPTIIKKSITIRDDLVSEVDQVMDFITSYITKEYIITGRPQREEKWQYPLTAIREFVINAIIHRDYRSGIHSQFKVFRDKIEFWNYGKLPSEITIENLFKGTEKSIPRNIKVAEIFKEIGQIEKYGSGVKRAIDEIVSYGLLQPQMTEIAGGINVLIKGNFIDGKEGDKEGHRLTENQKSILSLIRRNNSISTQEISIKININKSNTEKNIAKLKKLNLLKRIGSAKGGRWQIIANI